MFNNIVIINANNGTHNFKSLLVSIYTDFNNVNTKNMQEKGEVSIYFFTLPFQK